MSKLWNIMPDEKIPGTLNVGYVLPTVVQAVIFMTIVEVEFTTLICIIGAAVVGAFMGAGVVSGFNRRQVQVGMGIALLAASALMVLSLSGRGPAPGVALGLSGAKLGIAIVISTFLGASDDARHRLLRTVPHHDQPAGNGSARLVSRS